MACQVGKEGGKRSDLHKGGTLERYGWLGGRGTGVGKSKVRGGNAERKTRRKSNRNFWGEMLFSGVVDGRAREWPYGFYREGAYLLASRPSWGKGVLGGKNG